MVEVGMPLGANTKACMYSIEFVKYLFSTILPLFPDAAYTQDKHLAIIVDSGPARVNSSMPV